MYCTVTAKNTRVSVHRSLPGVNVRGVKCVTEGKWGKEGKSTNRKEGRKGGGIIILYHHSYVFF